MRMAPGLVSLAAGAILAFATRLEWAGTDLRGLGWILMAAGVAGLFLAFRHPSRPPRHDPDS